MATSRFVEGKSVNKKQRQFESWLKQQGYEAASEYYPGAVRASDLVEEFFVYYHDLEDEDTLSAAIRKHASLIGFVSSNDSDPGDIDDELIG